MVESQYPQDPPGDQYSATPWPAGPHPAAPPVPQNALVQQGVPQPAPPRPPVDKSVGAALVLTFLFGPLGLFYCSIAGALIMIGVDVVVAVLAVVTLGVGAVLFFFTWAVTMIWAAMSASKAHRDF